MAHIRPSAVVSGGNLFHHLEHRQAVRSNINSSYAAVGGLADKAKGGDAHYASEADHNCEARRNAKAANCRADKASCKTAAKPAAVKKTPPKPGKLKSTGQTIPDILAD